MDASEHAATLLAALQSELAESQAKTDRFIQTVVLFETLGGGWGE